MIQEDSDNLNARVPYLQMFKDTVATKEASTKGKGSKSTLIFEPFECRFSETNASEQVANPIPMNEGIDMLDSNTGELLKGPLGSIHLEPICP